jgi:hypothetical protein
MMGVRGGWVVASGGVERACDGTEGVWSDRLSSVGVIGGGGTCRVGVIHKSEECSGIGGRRGKGYGTAYEGSETCSGGKASARCKASTRSKAGTKRDGVEAEMGGRVVVMGLLWAS